MVEYMVKVFEQSLRIQFMLIKRIVKAMGKSPETLFMQSACKAIESSDFEAAFKLRVKEPDCNLFLKDNQRTEPIAIILQGPIVIKEKYTLKTVSFYKELYPNDVVIVSTWDDVPADILEELKQKGAEIVLSHKPKCCGLGNVNLQVITSLAGIKHAEKHGIKYALKTRTDQRICKPHVLDTLFVMLKIYPPCDLYGQETRIIVLAGFFNIFFPYFLSDFFYFGATKEMLRIFSTSVDDRDSSFVMKKNSTPRDYSRDMYNPEIYILKHYLKTIGFSAEDNVDSYWRAVRECFVCVDEKLLDLHWTKYDIHKYRLHLLYGEYYKDDTSEKKRTERMDYVNWMRIYYEVLKYKPEYEKYADVVYEKIGFLSTKFNDKAFFYNVKDKS